MLDGTVDSQATVGERGCSRLNFESYKTAKRLQEVFMSFYDLLNCIETCCTDKYAITSQRTVECGDDFVERC